MRGLCKRIYNGGNCECPLIRPLRVHLPPRGKAGRRPVDGQQVTNAKTGRPSYVYVAHGLVVKGYARK